MDHITNNFVTNTEAGTSGVNKLSADKFQTFLKSSQGALSQVLSPDEMNRLSAIAQDIQQSQRTLGATKLAGQSNTAQDVAKGGIIGHGAGPSMLGMIIGGALGHVAQSVGHIPMAEEIGGAAGLMAQSFRSAGISKVNDLVQRAVFDPDVAKALMAKVSGPNDMPRASRVLMRALVAPSLNVASQAKPQQAPNSALSGVTP